MGQPQVHVAAVSERFEHLQLADRQPGDAEQREPLRQIDSVGIGGQFGKGGGASGDRVVGFSRHSWVGDSWVGGSDPLPEAAPQLALPGQIWLQIRSEPVTGNTGRPRREHGRPVGGISVEQAREPACHGIPAATAILLLGDRHPVPEVRRQGAAPRLADRLVDDLEQRPDQAVRSPRVVAIGARHRGHHRVRMRELHAGADAVRVAVAAAQPMRQLLRQPAFRAAGGDGDDFLGEDVGQRVGQQFGQPEHQSIGPFAAVDVQGHRPIVPPRSSTGSGADLVEVRDIGPVLLVR